MNTTHNRIANKQNQALARSYGSHTSTVAGRNPYRYAPHTRAKRYSMRKLAVLALTTFFLLAS